MTDTYTLTETINRPDGRLTALFEVTRAGGGRYFERITAVDLPAIFARLGVEPPSELPPAPEPVLSVRWTVEDFAASAG